MIRFGQALCADRVAASRREWLVTNGIGGYAAGTVGSVPTRCYHGLLIAALDPPLGRTLLLAGLDLSVTYAGRSFSLAADARTNGEHAAGFRYLESFQLAGTTPIWTYALSDALLEIRLWMQPGANTTYLRYRLVRASAPLDLRFAARATYRDHHNNVRAGDLVLHSRALPNGLMVQPADSAATPFYILGADLQVTPGMAWDCDYFLAIEHERGLLDTEDFLRVGRLQANLAPGESLLLAVTTDAASELDAEAAWATHAKREAELQARIDWSTDPAVHRLALAADQFIVDRQAPGVRESGKTVLAGYHWFSDWGRDTMIALPGLTLPTGRPELAAMVLRTFAHFVSQGMLPNRFPDAGEEPEYNTADATLWFFEAIRAYLAHSDDEHLLRDLFPVLREIVAWHERGTRYGIAVDPADGLLRAGEADSQLTWMDVRVQGWVVTPRHGKAVELNALWYNALRTMAEFAARLGQSGQDYSNAADRVLAGFARFWNPERGYCYDVIDSPIGADATLRPNQIFAVALHHSPLDPIRQKAVVDICMQRLLTGYGLRSLDPEHPDYQPRYSGPIIRRDGAYHQGTVWGWLIGPFVRAHLRVYHDPATARSFLTPLLDHLSDAGLGTVSEIFDAEPPHTPRGCVAQAWSVAELLAALHLCLLR
ncbi:MAG: glycogen debranching protein [Oscillochloris sp.]|nr:glycogen debranching protein [Oscillochloris sp.]